MTSFRDIIDLWPSVSAFAVAIGVRYGTAQQMRNRNSIDGAYWQRLVDAAQKQGFRHVDLELLAKAATARKGHMPITARQRRRRANITRMSA
jgi:hypothetical protein